MNEFYMIAYTEVDGVRTFRDSEIEELYLRLLREGGGHVFRDGSIKSAPQFLLMAKSPHVAFYALYVRGKVAGVVWLNRFQARWAQCSFFIFREHWGEEAISLGRHCLRELLHSRDEQGAYCVDMLMGLMPADNHAAIGFVLRCGCKKLGELPCGAYDVQAGKSLPAVLTTVTREDVREEA